MTESALIVLYVEDDEDDAEMVQRALAPRADGPWRLEVVSTLERALARLAGGPCDVVLLDLHLPDAEGEEALARLREARPDLPVVAITGSAPEAGLRPVAAGAQDFIPKDEVRKGTALERALRHAVERSRFQAERRAIEARLAENESRLRTALESGRLEAEFLRAQKMEALGRLAGGVAHDFNNLLSAITGFGSLVRRALPPASPALADLDEILTAAQRAAALTRQLLAFSRKQPARAEVVDPGAVLTGIEKLLRRLIGEDIRLECTVAPDLATIAIDPGQLEQAIMNLAVNARDAMPRGGTLAFRLSNLPPDRVALEVADSGVGMDERVRARLFEPFFTTKELGRGTGLGLATVHGIVTQHGGRIEVESAPGRGSRFTLAFPRATAVPPPGLAPGTAAPAPAASPAPRTVLLAEDDEQVRRVTERTLSLEGYRVLAAGSGEEALALARAHAGPIHLLVTDVVMPGMRGPELARALAALRPGTPVLFVSGYVGGDRDGAGGAPLRPLLDKPFSPDALLAAVAAALAAK